MVDRQTDSGIHNIPIIKHGDKNIKHTSHDPVSGLNFDLLFKLF